MRPKDFHQLFATRPILPTVQDGIFCLPKKKGEPPLFSFPSWEEIFGNQNPVCIEFCSGNGDWIASKAINHKEINWVAVEMRKDRVSKIWAKKKNHQLNNLFCAWSEASSFVQFFLKEDSVDEIFIHFPDPWPKRRHEKNRLMHSAFIEELSRILKKGKLVTFVTDDDSYLHFALKKLLSQPKFIPFMEAPHYSKKSESSNISWFEALFREQGKEIYITQFQKD